MLCLGGLTLGGAITAPLAPTRYPIVGWGDSLTQGAGSTDGLTYLAQAASLLDDRIVLNRGIGGQDANSVAARQGGVPILVSLAGDTIPARQNGSWSWNFDTGVAGAIHVGAERGGSLGVFDGVIEVGVESWLQGIGLDLGQDLPQHTQLSVSLDITVPAGMTVRVSGIKNDVLLWAANNGAGAEGVQITASGHYDLTLFVGGLEPGRPTSMNRLVILNEEPPGNPTSFSVDNVVVTVIAAAEPVAITARSVSAIPKLSSMAGYLAGIHGTIAADASGAWSFSRSDEGPAVPCPPQTTFHPDEAAYFRRHTNWIWIGNNGVEQPGDAAEAALVVTAMTDYLQHNRYLVLAALPRPDRLDAIAAFNEMLAADHGSRFIDVLATLQAAGDGSSEDQADVTAGLVPRSLRTDDVHLTNAGYGIVAQAVASTMQARRW